MYMALLVIKLRISQCLFGVNGINWDQVMDHFLKVCKYLHAYNLKFIFTAYFGPHTCVVG